MLIKFENAASVKNHNGIGSLTAGKAYEAKETKIMHDDGSVVDSGNYAIKDDTGDILSIECLESCKWIGGAKWIEVE